MSSIVSIIIPLYNASAYVAETLHSVLCQTYRDWEAILVDDCSTDNTVDVVKCIIKEDSRLKLYCLEKNVGKASCLNFALPKITGRYLAFLDSDDIWMPNKLEKQLAFMKRDGYPITCTSYVQFSDSEKADGRIFHAKKKVDYQRMLLDCPVGNSTVIYDIEQLGKQRVPDIRRRIDDALWLQILKQTPYIWGLDEVLMKYRVREGSLSSNKIGLVKYHWKLYREIEHIGVLSSVFHIVYWGIIKVLGIK